MLCCISALASFNTLAASDNSDGLILLEAVIKPSSCVPDFQLNIADNRPVQLPPITSSNFKRNSLSAVSYFSIKLNTEPTADTAVNACKGVSMLSGIQFDATPNATSVLGLMKNQSNDNTAQNINVELILFSSDWARQHIVNLRNQEAIDFNLIPGWTQDKEEKKIRQLNFGVRYSKDATSTEEVEPGKFYVVLPFMLKFN